MRAALFEGGLPAKYLDLPVAQYAVWKYDRVENQQGEIIGISQWTGYLATERKVVSLGVVEESYAAPGTEVTVIWGEIDGGERSQPWIEQHRPFPVRATVAPVPLSRVARDYWAQVKLTR